MLITRNFTPFSVGGMLGVDLDGKKRWIVAVRATFMVGDRGELVRDKDQQHVSRAPVFEGDPASSALKCDADFCFAKVATDVVVRGTAWTPGGRPAPHVDVGFEVGALRKTLRVHGDRAWVQAARDVLVPSRAVPFISMPVSHQRAFGGKDPGSDAIWSLNPLGRGYGEDPKKLLHTLVPNVEDLREPVVDSTHRPTQLAGFGALPASWPQRAQLAGTYDGAWQRRRAPLWPLDFDPRFFQIAPSDQQAAGFLRGDEGCTLVHLTQEGRLHFSLPGIRVHVETHFSDGANDERYADLHTVLIEPDERRVVMVWHMALPCQGREHLVQQSNIRFQGRQSWVERPTSTA